MRERRLAKPAFIVSRVLGMMERALHLHEQ